MPWRPAESNPFLEKFNLKLSPSQKRKFEEVSKNLNISMRTMIVRAVENEIAKGPEGLEFHSPMPLRSYNKKYDSQSAKLMWFIKKYPGLSIEDLCYMLDDIGRQDVLAPPVFETKDDLMICLWYLIDQGIVVPKESKMRDYTAYYYNIATNGVLA